VQDEQNPNEQQDDEEILATARKRFDLAADAERENRELALEDLDFSVGEQWPDAIKADRIKEAKPTLTINRLPQFIQQITNDQRQNRPSIKVSPVDDGADIETAKIYQGLIRHIEYDSNADVAYDTAFDGTVRGGLGYFRVITQYCDPYSFEQEIKIKRIRNRFMVYLDPHSQEPDGSDSEWGTIFEDISWETYRSRYKEAKNASLEDWTSIGDTVASWANAKTVRIAEYFYKVNKEVDMVLLDNGFVAEKAKLPKDNPHKILKERKALIPTIKWVIHNGLEILDSTDWLGAWIPIVPVLGNEIDVDGKRILEGVVRHAKDPQRMYNYWASAETEMIALSPKAPFIGAEGQFKGKEDQWNSANRRNIAYLEYCPVTVGGQLAPPPTRNVYEAPVMAITNARAQSAEDLKATTGIYDAGLGNRSNENSGVAIQRRAAQSQTANFHFVDNLQRSIRHLGRILVDLIPKVYDTPRSGRILGEDGETDIVKLNQIFEKPNGQKAQYNLNAGKYDVTVSSGPSYATKRQEAADTMMEFAKANPQAAPLIADLIAQNMDWPMAKEIAERLKKTLPPGVADDKDEKKQPIPPEAEQKMQQMSQMIDQLTATVHGQASQIETKQMELESKERIEFKKLEVEVALKELEVGSKESMALLAHEIESINARLQMVGINEPIDNENDVAGPEQAAPQINQQPIGGLSPSEPME
jgi:hypothetical protein